MKDQYDPQILGRTRYRGPLNLRPVLIAIIVVLSVILAALLVWAARGAGNA